MPIYEYKCEVCGYEKEVEQKINDPAPICSGLGSDHCEYCEAESHESIPMKKLISKSSFALKGGTWARDNYSRKSK